MLKLNTSTPFPVILKLLFIKQAEIDVHIQIGSNRIIQWVGNGIIFVDIKCTPRAPTGTQSGMAETFKGHFHKTKQRHGIANNFIIEIASIQTHPKSGVFQELLPILATSGLKTQP